MTLIGVIRADVAAGVAILRRVAIHEDLQRRGYGRRLLDAAEQFAKGRGCRRVDSTVDVNAVLFYERCGHRRVNYSPQSRRHLHDDVVPALLNENDTVLRGREWTRN